MKDTDLIQALRTELAEVYRSLAAARAEAVPLPAKQSFQDLVRELHLEQARMGRGFPVEYFLRAGALWALQNQGQAIPEPRRVIAEYLSTSASLAWQPVYHKDQLRDCTVSAIKFTANATPDDKAYLTNCADAVVWTDIPPYSWVPISTPPTEEDGVLLPSSKNPQVLFLGPSRYFRLVPGAELVTVQVRDWNYVDPATHWCRIPPLP